MREYPGLMFQGPKRLQVVKRSHWESLSHKQRNERIRRGAVHVVGPPKTPHGITGIDDPKLKNLINIDAKRQCRGASFHRAMFNHGPPLIRRP